MTKQEKLIMTAYTGILMIDFDEFHKFVQEKLNRPVWTHEFASDEFMTNLKEIVKEDFLKICTEEEKCK
jgi:hypothetical protein